jgi:hypothetical protein
MGAQEKNSEGRIQGCEIPLLRPFSAACSLRLGFPAYSADPARTDTDLMSCWASLFFYARHIEKIPVYLIDDGIAYDPAMEEKRWNGAIDDYVLNKNTPNYYYCPALTR